MISRAARRTNSQIALFAVAVQPDPKIKARLVELRGTVLALSPADYPSHTDHRISTS